MVEADPTGFMAMGDTPQWWKGLGAAHPTPTLHDNLLLAPCRAVRHGGTVMVCLQHHTGLLRPALPWHKVSPHGSGVGGVKGYPPPNGLTRVLPLQV